MKVSVIVVTHNRAKQLERCLDSLDKQTERPFEIVVIDDGSTDNTKATVEKTKGLKYFRQEKKSIAHARNKGLEKAKGDIIAFTDDDCIVSNGWVQNIRKAFERYPQAGALGGPIACKGDNKYAVAFHLLNFSRSLGSGRVHQEKDMPICNMAYRKEAIRNTKFQEEGTQHGYEDSLFNYALKKKGVRLFYIPDISVTHAPAIESKKEFLRKQRQRGRAFFSVGYKVHGIPGLLLRKFPFLNLLCLRLFLVSYRCLSDRYYWKRFIRHLPTVFCGEFERGTEILREKIKKLY